MSIEERPAQAAAGADGAAALAEAVRRVRQEARAIAEAADLVAGGEKESAPDREGGVTALQARVADFRSLTVDLERLLEDRHAHESQLASQLDVLRQADHEQAVQRQQLQQRLRQTQEALRYANASLQGLRQIYRLLCQEVLEVTDCIRVPMLQEATHSAHFTAEWSAFLASGRLSPSVEAERALRQGDDEPLTAVTAQAVLQR